MIDRNVADETKYRLTPVGGGASADYVISSLATGVEGTPLLKRILLSDSVGESFGLNAAQTDNTASDFISPNNTFAAIRVLFDGLLDFFYPVGTIYQTDTITSASAMASHFGGTWTAWGAGKVPVGYSSGDADFGTVNATGGSKTSFQTHTHSTPDHTHTVDNATPTMVSSGNGTSGSTTPGTTGNASASHTHTFSYSLGSHDHDIGYITYTVPSGTTYAIKGLDSAMNYTIDAMTNNGSATVSGTTGTNSVTHNHTSAAHTHTTPDHTHTMNAHTHTVTSSGAGTSGSAGTTGSTNLQPYQVCYFWKRTA